MQHKLTKPVRRVAVIGAGAAGIAQAKQAIDAFSRSEFELELVVFEARDQVGGVWVEDPTPGPSTVRYNANSQATAVSLQPGVLPSPIYPGLRTNLPHDLMTFRNEPFPPATDLFPKAISVLKYLQDYADKYGLGKFVRFNSMVTRVFKEEDGEKWVVESRGEQGQKTEAFDYISVTNGHYEKANLPDIPGLKDFSGNIIHSRWYRQPSNYHAQTVIVIGAFASGSDIARELAYENIPRSRLPPAYTSHLPPTPEPSRSPTPESRIRVIQSSSGGKSVFSAPTEQDEWKDMVEQRGLISHITTKEGEQSVIHFKDGSEVTGVDSMIIATGYLYHLPFFKVEDRPWSEGKKVLDWVIDEVDVSGQGEEAWELGGMKGLGVKDVDELLIFLREDRSMAFIGLNYLCVPFPLFEIQSHLTSLLWAGLLPSFPSHAALPPNPKHLLPPSLADSDPSASAPPAGKRYTETIRGEFVLGYPYEYIYENALLALCEEGDGGVKGGWGEVENWRYARREDTGLRRIVVGY